MAFIDSLHIFVVKTQPPMIAAALCNASA